ncbi:hypothetical protein [Phaeospirillum tilakii]|uniref:CASP-like protein n=1 Tax=Phaeospirillum tilakii TaxID=741673 RepID=A0ABW5CC88_9PROT
MTNDNIKYYSERLPFLWEQYIKYVTLGIFGTAALAGGLIILLKDVQSDLWQYRNYLSTIVWLDAVSCLSFMLCRWSSQILMERHSYGDYDKALSYFSVVGGVIPSALKGGDDSKNKKYIRRCYRVNNIAKFIGSGAFAIAVLMSAYTLMLYFNDAHKKMTPLSAVSTDKVDRSHADATQPQKGGEGAASPSK